MIDSQNKDICPLEIGIEEITRETDPDPSIFLVLILLGGMQVPFHYQIILTPQRLHAMPPN